MAVATADLNQTQQRTGLNRFDSPWLNPKFLTGLAMVSSIALMAILGPIFWDTEMAKVAKAPLNLPPPWAPGFQVEETIAAADSPQSTGAASNSESEAETVESNVAAEDNQSITGGNPLARTSEQSGETQSGSITGGNPLAQNQDTSASITGGNPLAQSSSTDASSAQEENAASAGQASATPQRRSPFGIPTWEHPLGTESSGRDMLAVLLVGAPRSLWIGIIAAGIGMIIGIILGFTAGFLGGWVDAIIRTVSDAFITIPSLAVLIVVSAFVSFNNITYMALMLAIFAWPGPTRLLRSQVLSMRERGYVQMARLSGASTFDILFKEMMPNLLPYLAASFTGNVSGAILAATGLEVLGLGPTRIPTLGITIFYAIRAAAILRGMWWWWGVPIAALVVIFAGLFLITIGLDEIANPRLRGAQA